MIGISWLSILVLSQVAAEEPPAVAKLTLQVASERLLPHDPLVVRVVLENLGKTPIVIEQPFEAETGRVQFERRYPGDEWHAIYTANTGLASYEPDPKAIAPATRIAAYEVLFRGREGPVFAVLGKQEVRAVVGVGRQRFESDPVAVEVVAAPQGKEPIASKAAAFLDEGGIAIPARVEEATRWESLLPDSELKTAFKCAKAMVALRKANSPASREAAAAELKRVRAGLGSIQNESLSLSLAQHFSSQKNWQAVIDELATMKFRTSRGDELRRFAEYWQKMAAARKLADGDLKVELLPAGLHLQVGDPLLLKVKSTNVSKDAIKLPERFASEGGTLHLELLGPRDTEYQKLPSPKPAGPRMPFAWKSKLAPGGAVFSCEVVFKAGKDRFAFTTPGTYRLRARVSAEGEALGDSPPLELTVSARREGRGAVEAEAESLVRNGLVALGGSVTSEPHAYEAAAAKLEPSQLKTTLHWLAAVARLRDATEPAERERAREEFDLLKNEFDRVTRDHMNLSLAEVLIRAKEYQAATLILQFDPSAQSGRLYSIIREKQHEEEAAKAASKMPGK